MRVFHVILATCVLFSAMVGCDGSASPITQDTKESEMLSCVPPVPADLPSGMQCRDKSGASHYVTANEVKQQYSSEFCHGWHDCLCDLSRDWTLSRDPDIMQGYSWQVRGYIDGYRACQLRVKMIVEQTGVQPAKEAVRTAVLRKSSE